MTPEELIINIGLYSKTPITPETLDTIYHSLYSRERIDLYCVECNKMATFESADNVPKKTQVANVVTAGRNVPTRKETRVVDLTSEEWSRSLKGESIVSKELKCTRNPTHLVRLSFLVKDMNLIKIGQHPSIADISNFNMKQFRRILGDENANEYSKAIGLYSHSIGVGSFVYLRRVVENFIIKPAYEEMVKTPDWDDEEYQGKRVKEKIELLKNRLPAFLVSNSEIYSILSKGIHELSEDECLEIFPAMLACINVILTEIKMIKEVEESKTALRKQIKAIHKDHKQS